MGDQVGATGNHIAISSIFILKLLLGLSLSDWDSTNKPYVTTWYDQSGNGNCVCRWLFSHWYKVKL